MGRDGAGDMQLFLYKVLFVYDSTQMFFFTGDFLDFADVTLKPSNLGENLESKC